VIYFLEQNFEKVFYVSSNLCCKVHLTDLNCFHQKTILRKVGLHAI